MYVGLAPDGNRNWSNLKGAYLNHLGLYVDAFSEEGWRRGRSEYIKTLIFEDLAEHPQCDFSTDGLSVPVEWPQVSICKFDMEVSMAEATVRFMTMLGVEFERLQLPGLLRAP